MNDIETIVSDNIKRILKEFRLNQNELARIAGVSESTVGKWVLKKSAPRMGAIEKIANHFNLPKSYILEENNEVTRSDFEYPYYPITISAGMPTNVDAVMNDQVEKIHLPDIVMGKYARDKNIFVTRSNGESMNRTIPHNSLMAACKTELHRLKNGDIVIYSNNHDYSVKRFVDDKENKRFIFKPDSTDDSFADHTVYYDESENLIIHGKVVMYIVQVD